MIYFLVPVFNEERNIAALASTLHSVLPDVPKFFVFVDDGSADHTCDLIRKHFSADELSLITKQSNQGPGDSFNRGFEWILANNKDKNARVVTIEGDNTSDVGILPVMYHLSNWGYDLVLASVYAQGGNLGKTSFFRRLVSLVANQFFRLLFDIKTLTLTSFYRVYSVELLQKIKADNNCIIREKGFICMLEILLKAIRLNASVIEVPTVLHAQKRQGNSKMKVIKTAISYVKFLIKAKGNKLKNS